MPARRVPAAERKAQAPLSRATLEFCDWLIDGVTIAANHPDFDREAARISKAKREVAKALVAAGGSPLAEQRKAEQQG
jgi:hypothetical protein